MKIRQGKTGISFSEIYNEAQFELVTTTAEQAGCNCKITDHNTKVRVTGTPAQLSAFVNLWNE